MIFLLFVMLSSGWSLKNLCVCTWCKYLIWVLLKSEGNGPDVKHIKLLMEKFVFCKFVRCRGTCHGWVWNSTGSLRAKNILSLPKACWWTVVQSSHPRDCPCSRFMTDAARREQESLKKKIQPKLSLTLSSTVSRGNVSTPPRHSSGSLTPPVTPPITPSSSFRSSTPTGKHPLFNSSQMKAAVLLGGVWRTGDILRRW